jgi:hypothetical protein
MPSRDELTLAWADEVLPKLKGITRALFSPGRFVDGAGPTFALPSTHPFARCEPLKAEVEAALAARFGRPVPLTLVADDEATASSGPGSGPGGPGPGPNPGGGSAGGGGGAGPGAPPPPLMDEVIDPDELVDAPPGFPSGIERLAAAFPGAQLIEEEA